MKHKTHLFACITACLFLLPCTGYPQGGDEHFRLAVLKDAVNDFAGVVEACNAALASGGKNATACYLRGKAKYHLGDYHGAIDDETRAIALGLQNEAVHVMRGKVWAALGDYKKAVRDFSKAISMNKQNWQVYYLRGLANNKLGYRRKTRLDYRQAALLGIKESADLPTGITEPD